MPVFLSGESHGLRNLVGYSPQGCKELDTTEGTQHARACVRTHTHTHTKYWIFIKKAFSSATALKNTGNSSNVKQLPYDLTVPLMYPKRNENMSTQVCSVKYYVQWTLEQHGAWRLGVLALCTMRPNWNSEFKAGKGLLQGHVRGWVAYAPKPQIPPKVSAKPF